MFVFVKRVGGIELFAKEIFETAQVDADQRMTRSLGILVWHWYSLSDWQYLIPNQKVVRLIYAVTV